MENREKNKGLRHRPIQYAIVDDPSPVFYPDQKLMALSWKQPYAGLMLHGKIETRTWPTKYRGWVLICASKKAYSLGEELTISGTEQQTRISMIQSRQELNLQTGVAIAIGFLVDCHPMAKGSEPGCFVQYKPGLWCHVYTHVQPIEPFEWKGSQGWKEVPQEVKDRIKIIDHATGNV